MPNISMDYNPKSFMTEITKVLIANRGEIACRILKSLAELGIPGVLVYHAMDAESPAVQMAGEVVEINGSTPVSAYLDMEAIVAACRETGADAVHPGFGFLAENAMFARRLADEGIIFIGPLPETIELMGNKISARAFCLAHGIPIAPSITETDAGQNFVEQASELELPILIKAAAGGGGKGMHVVRNIDQLEQAVKLAKGEALRSFGDDTVYTERYLENPRHIEVQVLGDHQGNFLHLGERECSIQRRYQKVIEESPAPNLAPELRERICSVAVDIARQSGYRNAGTVEFIMAPEGEFFFLEMNTRIQVEHPVTEMVTGLDMVALQIHIAQGKALPFTQDQVETNGHAIELRIYAEDPENDFLPVTGSLLRYRLPAGTDVRVDNGFTEGMRVSSAFDPMLAKLIAKGQNRDDAIGRAEQALQDTLILGVTTNIDFLARILAHPEFKTGHTHTGFIPQHSEQLRARPLEEDQRQLLLAAAALSSREFTNPVFETPEPYASMNNWRN